MYWSISLKVVSNSAIQILLRGANEMHSLTRWGRSLQWLTLFMQIEVELQTRGNKARNTSGTRRKKTRACRVFGWCNHGWVGAIRRRHASIRRFGYHGCGFFLCLSVLGCEVSRDSNCFKAFVLFDSGNVSANYQHNGVKIGVGSCFLNKNCEQNDRTILRSVLSI